MTDNTRLNNGSGDDYARDIDRGGNVKTQVVVLDIGGLSAESLVDSTNPMPVSANALPLPSGAATAGKQLPDNHQVAVSNFPATQPVSGTVAVSNPGLTDTELRATPVPVSGTFYQATQPVSGAVSVSNLETGLATSAKQDTLLTELQLKANLTEVQPVSDETVSNSLTRVLEQVSLPIWYDPVTNSLKAVVTGAVTATVSSTTVSSIGGIASDPQVPSLLNQVWASTVRGLLS